MSINAWFSEINRIFLVFVPCILIGFFTGYLSEFFILGLIIYGLWTARQLHTLKNWLDEDARVDQAPEYMGITDQHVTSVVNLQKSISKTKQIYMTQLIII